MKPILLCLLCLMMGIGTTGCRSLFHRALPGSALTPPSRPIHTTRIINIQRLQQGGKLLIIPFSPDVGVSACDESERIALRAVQGMAAGFDPLKTPFTILHADNAETAELIMKGRIIKMKESGGIKLWVLQKKKNRILEISGRIVDPLTNETLAIFNHARESRDPTVTWEDLAGLIGQDIGKEIADRI
jgi:hypothetical protein